MVASTVDLNVVRHLVSRRPVAGDVHAEQKLGANADRPLRFGRAQGHEIKFAALERCGEASLRRQPARDEIPHARLRAVEESKSNRLP
jgi:hypothetical protein